MTIGTVKRPAADLPRHRARKALLGHPPAPVDNTTGASLEQPAETQRLPATSLRPETAEHPKTETWAWSKAETERRRHADATQPTWPRSTPSPTEYATADDLAAIRLDADPDATGPHSQTIRGLLGGARARLAGPPDQRRALRRAARRQPYQPPLPPLRIRQINAFASRKAVNMHDPRRPSADAEAYMPRQSEAEPR